MTQYLDEDPSTRKVPFVHLQNKLDLIGDGPRSKWQEQKYMDEYAEKEGFDGSF